MGGTSNLWVDQTAPSWVKTFYETNYRIDSATGPCKFYFCTGDQRKSFNVKKKNNNNVKCFFSLLVFVHRPVPDMK